MRPISIVQEETMASGQVKFNATIYIALLTFEPAAPASTLVLRNNDKIHAKTDDRCEERKVRKDYANMATRLKEGYTEAHILYSIRL
jgi:hypothetical protein